MDLKSFIIGILFIIVAIINYIYSYRNMSGEEGYGRFMSIRSIFASVILLIGGILILCGRI